MSAYYDWSIVGRSAHPIGGDPDLVSAVAREFTGTAEDIRGATTAIQRIENGDNKALFLDKAIEDAREITAVLWQALERYDNASEALTTYAVVQLQAQQQAEAALQAAAVAQESHRRAANRAQQIAAAHNQSTDPAQRDQLVADHHHANGDAAAAQASFREAERRIQEAIEDRNRAGDIAAAQIRDAIENKELNDSLADRLMELATTIISIAEDVLGPILELLKAIGKFIWDHIEEISLGLWLASMVLGWVPGLGQVLIVLALVSKAVAVLARVKLLVSVVQGVSTGVRTGDWSPLGATMVVLALGSVAKWGSAKLVNAGVKSTVEAVGVHIRPTTPPNKVLAWASWASGIGNMPGTAAYQTDQLVTRLKLTGHPDAALRAEMMVGVGKLGDHLVGDALSGVEDTLAASNPRLPGCQQLLTQPVLVPAGGGGGGRAW